MMAAWRETSQYVYTYIYNYLIVAKFWLIYCHLVAEPTAQYETLPNAGAELAMHILLVSTAASAV